MPHNGQMKKLIQTLCPLLLLMFLLSNARAAEYAFTGEARDQQGQVQYLENHQVKTDSGDLIAVVSTTYTKPDGTQIATLTSNFEKNKFVPESHFKDLRSGYEEITAFDGEKLKVTVIKNGKSKTKLIKLKENSVMGQGYHNYVLSHFDKLKDKQTLGIDFIVASELTSFSFNIISEGVVGERLKLKLELGSWFLGLFLGPLKVEYDLQKRLQLFDGLTNVGGDDGKRRELVITFKYE